VSEFSGLKLLLLSSTFWFPVHYYDEYGGWRLGDCISGDVAVAELHRGRLCALTPAVAVRAAMHRRTWVPTSIVLPLGALAHIHMHGGRRLTQLSAKDFEYLNKDIYRAATWQAAPETTYPLAVTARDSQPGSETAHAVQKVTPRAGAPAATAAAKGGAKAQPRPTAFVEAVRTSGKFVEAACASTLAGIGKVPPKGESEEQPKQQAKEAAQEQPPVARHSSSSSSSSSSSTVVGAIPTGQLSLVRRASTDKPMVVEAIRRRGAVDSPATSGRLSGAASAAAAAELAMAKLDGSEEDVSCAGSVPLQGPMLAEPQQGSAAGSMALSTGTARDAAAADACDHAGAKAAAQLVRMSGNGNVLVAVRKCDAPGSTASATGLPTAAAAESNEPAKELSSAVHQECGSESGNAAASDVNAMPSLACAVAHTDVAQAPADGAPSCSGLLHGTVSEAVPAPDKNTGHAASVANRGSDGPVAATADTQGTGSLAALISGDQEPEDSPCAQVADSVTSMHATAALASKLVTPLPLPLPVPVPVRVPAQARPDPPLRPESVAAAFPAELAPVQRLFLHGTGAASAQWYLLDLPGLPPRGPLRGENLAIAVNNKLVALGASVVGLVRGAVLLSAPPPHASLFRPLSELLQQVAGGTPYRLLGPSDLAEAAPLP